MPTNRKTTSDTERDLGSLSTLFANVSPETIIHYTVSRYPDRVTALLESDLESVVLRQMINWVSPNMPVLSTSGEKAAPSVGRSRGHVRSGREGDREEVDVVIATFGGRPGEGRAAAEVFSRSDDGTVIVAPLAHWTRGDMEEFIVRHDIPRHSDRPLAG